MIPLDVMLYLLVGFGIGATCVALFVSIRADSRRAEDEWREECLIPDEELTPEQRMRRAEALEGAKAWLRGETRL